MRTVERDRFIPSELRDHAYDDGPLPIGADQTISQPYMVALTLRSRTADAASSACSKSAPAAATRPRCCRSWPRKLSPSKVIPHLYDRARLILQGVGASNVSVRLGDGSLGCIEEAPFDAIIVSAAMPGVPTTLLTQLKPDGRLVAPIGEEELQTLVRIARINGHWQEEYFGECRYVKMTGKHGFTD